jgi:polar amino acid transport system permease protein
MQPTLTINRGSAGIPVINRKTAEHRRHPVAPPRRWRPSLIVSCVVVLLAAAIFANAVARSEAMDWSVVGHYLFQQLILTGLLHTVELTVLCEVLAIISGGVLAWLLASGNVAWRSAVHVYQWFFRSVPELAQLIFWFNLSLLFPALKIGIPFGGPAFGHFATNNIMTPWVAVTLGIGLHEGAYLAEVFRSGFASVPAGQQEACQALGLSPRRTFWRVVFPQAMWVIVPNAGSRLIGTLKITSLASVLAIQELLYTTESIYSRTFQTIPLLLVATVWYMVCVAVLRVIQQRLEIHYAKARGNRPRVATPMDALAEDELA